MLARDRINTKSHWYFVDRVWVAEFLLLRLLASSRPLSYFWERKMKVLQQSRMHASLILFFCFGFWFAVPVKNWFDIHVSGRTYKHCWITISNDIAVHFWPPIAHWKAIIERNQNLATEYNGYWTDQQLYLPKCENLIFSKIQQCFSMRSTDFCNSHIFNSANVLQMYMWNTAVGQNLH